MGFLNSVRSPTRSKKLHLHPLRAKTMEQKMNWQMGERQDMGLSSSPAASRLVTHFFLVLRLISKPINKLSDLINQSYL